MLKATMGKALLLASAIAGLALIAAPPPSKAASAGVCAGFSEHRRSYCRTSWLGQRRAVGASGCHGSGADRTDYIRRTLATCV